MAARFIAARCDHGPAVIRTLALAALALAGPMVTALPAAAARPDVRVVSVTHVVAKNDEATLVARVAPADARCNLVIYPRSGPSAARGRTTTAYTKPPANLTRGRWARNGHTAWPNWLTEPGCARGAVAPGRRQAAKELRCPRLRAVLGRLSGDAGDVLPVRDFPDLLRLAGGRIEQLVRLEGCANPVSSGEVVFVDEAAEPVAALDGSGW